MGHFKRAIEIWARLGERFPADVTIACEEWQWQMSRTNINLQRAEAAGVKFLFPNMDGALRWYDDARNYSKEAYFRFLSHISQQLEFSEADVVISDNLAGILDKHPKVLLLGSFLWSDVLKTSVKKDLPEEILNHETDLLQAFRPRMISVKEVTMPAVAALTNNIGINWLCDSIFERPFKKDESTYSIVFTTGLSGSLGTRILDLYQNFQANPSYSVSVTPAFCSSYQIEEADVKLFDFSSTAFEATDIMVARPGIGSITECIKYQIPVVAVDDGMNSEMAFNSLRVAELGIGWGQADLALVRAPSSEEYNDLLLNLRKRPVNGFFQLEELLTTYL